tara:strand:- start:3790 stop:5007 length:1218 start_codon:yes stop_codon:yes gene_type:complete
MDDAVNSKPIILFNTHVYPRFKNDHVAPFMHEFAKVCSTFARVVVHCPHAPGLPLQETIDGVEIRRFRYAREHRQTLAYQGDMHKQVKKSIFKALLFYTFLRKWKKATKKVIRELNPDIVHAHWLIPGGYITNKAMRKETNLYISMHGTDVFLINKMKLAKRLAQNAIKSATNVHFVSEALQAIVAQQYGDSNGQGLVLPMVFGLEDFRQGPVAAAKDTKRILFVGRLMKVKGIDVLINAFSRLLEDERFIEWKLDIVGGGPELESLRTLSQERGVEHHIEFHGSKPRRDLKKFYNQAELFVLPSRTTSLGEKEGLGLVVLEAMMAGVPVIGTDCGGIKETITHHKTGIIVPEGDINALHNSMVDLLDNNALRSEMVQNAHSEIDQKYTIESLTSTMKQWYGVVE